MKRPKVVSQDDWVAARKRLLVKEKQFSRQRDALSAERRKLPMVAIEKEYVFQGLEGRRTLADLFDGKPQLLTYHFMFGPDWGKEGCPSCSYVADNFAGSLVHLAARDTAFAVISRAPFEKIKPFKQRMGWTFPWLSSFGTDFNYDFGVTLDETHTMYNYAPVAAQPDGHRQHAGHHGDRRHDDRTCALVAGFADRGQPVLARAHLLDGEVHEQDRVLCHDSHQHQEADGDREPQ